jgi:taurine dioxygenase
VTSPMLYARREGSRVACADGDLLFRRLGGGFGATVEGIDLSVPATERQAAALRDALTVYSLLCFPDQALEPADEVRTLRIFNDISDPTNVDRLNPDGVPEIIIVSNIVDAAGKPLGYANKRGMEWHTDGSGWARPPLASSLYAIEVPSTGGETYFANGHLAFETLPAAERAMLDGKMATYDYVVLQRWLAESGERTTFLSEEEQLRYPKVDRPLVRRHPDTGRKALWFSIEEITDIDGMGREAARELLLGLITHMVSTQHVVYRHDWTPGDLVIWDNRCLMHSVCDYNYEGQRRLMHQITGKDLNCDI